MKRKSSFACGKKLYRIFCKKCGSWCVFYRNWLYPWSDEQKRIILVTSINTQRSLITDLSQMTHHFSNLTDKNPNCVANTRPSSFRGCRYSTAGKYFCGGYGCRTGLRMLAINLQQVPRSSRCKIQQTKQNLLHTQHTNKTDQDRSHPPFSIY